ncbi:MAG: FAD-dependent oxidoreductase [Ferruginibacter sp.]|nr:FAD-dependent oxidoreductase [Ferruginibacter sp.]
MQPWQKGIVTRIENETTDTKRFWIQIPELNAFDFQAGQFVTLDLPIHEKPNKRWRSYSIASWPDGSNTIELLIVLNKEGLGTPYLFNQVSVGSELTLRGPVGVFTLPEDIQKDIFLICTGTGVAPFRSMLHHIKNKNVPHKNLYLVFGCRKKENLLYYNELMGLQKEMKNFFYFPTLSREQWDGRCGYVHAIYTELCEQKKPAYFFLCGWKEMIDEAKATILDMGYDKKDIHLEIYG